MSDGDLPTPVVDATAATDHPQHPEMAPHYYGGQAVIEGVMMRGADSWAVAVRRPNGEIYVECNGVGDTPKRYPILTKPMFRGIYALGDSLKIGMRALQISASESLGDEDEELPGAAMGASLVVAMFIFVGLFIVLPSAGLKAVDSLLPGDLGDGALFHLVESFIRIGIFLAYLMSISLIADIRRVFEYHGAEHKTIAAWEHGEPLDPEAIDKYSTLHVRCGTNFLIIVMLLALVVYTLAGFVYQPPADSTWIAAVLYHVALRVVLLPVIAGLAYEGIRLGAGHEDNVLVAALMKPGLWLQLITTKPPTHDQIEVAIRAFEAVVPEEHLGDRVPVGLPSAVVIGGTLADPDLIADPVERIEGA